jgi:hypothetical protein
MLNIPVARDLDILVHDRISRHHHAMIGPEFSHLVSITNDENDGVCSCIGIFAS